MDQLNVSLVYGAQVARGTPAAAFAGNAAVELVHPIGEAYPVIYVRESATRIVAAGEVRGGVFGVTSRFSDRKERNWERAIIEACRVAKVVASGRSWLVVCDVR